MGIAALPDMGRDVMGWDGHRSSTCYGTGWDGMGWGGVECSRMRCNGVGWGGVEPDWIGLDWVGQGGVVGYDAAEQG